MASSSHVAAMKGPQYFLLSTFHAFRASRTLQKMVLNHRLEKFPLLNSTTPRKSINTLLFLSSTRKSSMAGREAVETEIGEEEESGNPDPEVRIVRMERIQVEMPDGSMGHSGEETSGGNSANDRIKVQQTSPITSSFISGS